MSQIYWWLCLPIMREYDVEFMTFVGFKDGVGFIGECVGWYVLDSWRICLRFMLENGLRGVGEYVLDY
ncbi:hypothetical protein QJS10_CPA01g03013 [Acorus calamus]|uniref:Uncharacterized protein n=1 Tax=Acorus calamus TaxID=4465 RepID=A0AAV9FVS2_ACOCL|nr:hypothetical protein QJS10_CPA01g03013 [Acorus calamus]